MAIRNSEINVKQYGAKGDGVADDTFALQSAINQALQYDSTIFIPSGTYKISSGLIAYDTICVRIQGSGATTIIKPTLSTFDVITIKGSTVEQPSGYIRDLSIVGPSARPSGFKAALKLDGMKQFEVRNINVDNVDIGFDLVNNCFGSTFHNLRAYYGVNVGLNLRTGPQSGNDLTFYNVWLSGNVAAVHIANDSGGFHFYGGQFVSNAFQASNQDGNGAMIIGKDYITGTMGGVLNVTVDGVDFEGFKRCWAVRGYDQIGLTLRNCGMNPTDSTIKAIGLIKFTNAKQSKIYLEKINIKGYWSGTNLIDIGGNYDDCSLVELNSWIDANIASAGVTSSSLVAQSQITLGQGIFRANNHNTIALGKVFLRENGTSGLQVSTDFGATWNDLSSGGGGSATGLTLTAPNGSQYSISIDNMGSLTATLI